MRRIVLLVALLASGCGGGVESPPSASADAPGPSAYDAGAAAPDAGCGLSFDEAIEAYPGERVCQTTVYDRVTGYCTHWQPCSAL
jgi:hypothetical protein